MKLLIGIPSYNKPEELKEAILCLKKQTFTEFKVIISDDSDEASSQKIQTFIIELNDDRFSYLKNEKRRGLFGNMKYLWSLAYENSYDCFMWLCDDDVILDNEFIFNGIEFLSRNNNCAVVGYPCDRYLNGKLWYKYDNISTLGLSQKERVAKMTAYMKSNPNIFETMQYGIHKLENCPKHFEIGYRKSIITFFIIISFHYSIHTLHGKASVKNTDNNNLQWYLGDKHNNKSLPIVFRIFPLGVFVRLRILYHTINPRNIRILPWVIKNLL